MDSLTGSRRGPVTQQSHALDLRSLRDDVASASFHFGAHTNPSGDQITVDAVSLRRNGRPWLASMGEFHFSRYPQPQWRDALLKMQAGGIDIAATYVFWCHHEEVRSCYDWTDRRDLRAFVSLCRELDFPLVLRIGPWCHGEVRLGGLPAWLLDEPCEVRTNDAIYIAHVEKFYKAIAGQVEGLLWKDGGPIVGVQIENEYHGAPEHLLTLKEIAITAGFDVPFYTRTGWPAMTGPIPFGELLPLHGGYAEGFWDRSLEPMPGTYWREFTFTPTSPNTAVATDHFGEREAASSEAGYPYLTCELGGGMMTSYHRRIFAHPYDVYAIALAKIGSGSNLPGYYMYHGGVNPDGQLGDLNEQQNTSLTNHNDLPVKSYDFQTALGETGEARPQFHLLRRLHTFLRSHGEALCTYAPSFPAPEPTDKHDTQTLRFAVRSNGRSGYIFISNYQRLEPMPSQVGVRFQLTLDNDTLLAVPHTPVTVPADTACFWPFHYALGETTEIIHATAQPLARLVSGSEVFEFFTEIPGLLTEFVIRRGAAVDVCHPVASRQIMLTVPDRNRRYHIVLLSETDAMRFYQGRVGGHEVALLTDAITMFDGDTVRLHKDVPADGPMQEPLAASLFMPTGNMVARDSMFQRIEAVQPDRSQVPPPVVEKIRAAGPARPVANGQAGVPEAPHDKDFEEAAVYEIRVPSLPDSPRHFILRIKYLGDVARIYAGGKLLTDNFYNGRSLDVDLQRYASEVADGALLLKILPLRTDSPVHFTPGSRPNFGGNAEIAELLGLECIERVEGSINCLQAFPKP